MPPLALLHWQLVPIAHAKAKRLGRELSVKIELGGSCQVVLCPEEASPSVAAGVRGGAVAGGAEEEGYVVQLPALVLLDPLAAECPVAYKGG